MGLLNTLQANVSVTRQANLLDNLGTVLQFQSFAPTSADADYKLKLVSQFSKVVYGRINTFGELNHDFP